MIQFIENVFFLFLLLLTDRDHPTNQQIKKEEGNVCEFVYQDHPKPKHYFFYLRLFIYNFYISQRKLWPDIGS